MRRGEVRWYRFAPPDKRRPVLILTRTSVIEYLGEVTVVPITTTVRDIPSEVVLGHDDGMARECAANFDHIQTVQKARIGPVIATLSSKRMAQARTALHFALGFDDG